MNYVVFDIGAVLITWDAALAFEDSFDTRAECDAFLARIMFDKLNLAGDAGVSFDLLAETLTDPRDAALLSEYVARYAKSVPSKIEGTWDILRTLKAKGTPVHAITNWSAETWPEGVKAHPELAEVFETLIVSGQEGLIKPSVAIFHLFCERAQVAAQDCIFIDDGLHNVAGARAAGMDGIHFIGADALRADLTDRGLL
ncbi:MAG: HAD family phosphatase [Pseudomonadota bacterium]